MNYLRLRDDERQVTEFYIDDKPANYLKDIKQLNIIVGANNSRKSRFIRNVINLEHRVVITSGQDVNTLDLEIDEIFGELTKETMDVKLVAFIFNHYNDSPSSYQEIKSFFDNRSGMDTGLSLSDIKAILIDMVKSLVTISVPNTIENLNDNTSVQQKVLSLITSIYKALEKNFSRYSGDTPNDSGIKGITYKLPEARHLEGIIDFEEKLSTLEKAVQFITEFKQNQIASYYKANLVYLPVLRASRRLEGGDIEVFKKTLKSQYKLKDNSKLSIETGLDLYEKIEAARNGHRRDRENFSAFEDFISKVFFGGKMVDIIAVKSGSSSDRHVKISIQDELDDIPVHDLGDGIQSVITLLLPVFTAEEGSWIFIDEPENHLHPGFQNIFLRAISENKDIKVKQLKFFINTHSNHILSEALMGTSETEILVFSRRDKDSSNIQIFSGNEYNTLEMLGVFNTSVLITNCSVWVEGITDRLYMRSFLYAFCNADSSKPLPTEGFHYSFVEYAGNNIIHYDFDHDLAAAEDHVAGQIKAFFLNSNVFLLADSDFSKDDRHLFYEEISQKRKNFEYFKTELPEIENLIADSILKAWLTQEIKCTPEEVEACFNTPNAGDKLGKYFEDKFTFRKRKRKFMDKGHGGTLRPDYKMKLADYVHNGIMNGTIHWDQLKESDILADLVTRLYTFVVTKSGVGKSFT